MNKNKYPKSLKILGTSSSTLTEGSWKVGSSRLIKNSKIFRNSFVEGDWSDFTVMEPGNALSDRNCNRKRGKSTEYDHTRMPFNVLYIKHFKIKSSQVTFNVITL